MKTIILSIHNGGNGKYRFYVNSVDSRLIFKNRKQKVIIHIDRNKFKTHTTCGPKDWNNLKIGSNKGYDLYSYQISDWIIRRGYQNKKNGRCQRIKFKLQIRGGKIYLYKI